MPRARERARALHAWALLLACAPGCGEAPHGPSAARRQQLAAGESPAGWQDLDPAQPGRRRRDPRTGIVFVRVPAGEFTMGSTVMALSMPAHRVRLDQPFLLAETEVTVAQWRAYLRDTGAAESAEVAGAPTDHPACANHREASRFCELYGYRLPTEAEWEWACRGGQSDADGPWRSAAELQDYAWFHDDAGDRARPVATRKPNGYGLYDMLGNLWEWCADWFRPGYGSDLPDPVVDPRGPAGPQLDAQGTVIGEDRVLRGGSWFTVPAPVPQTRLFDNQYATSSVYGFRPACSLE